MIIIRRKKADYFKYVCPRCWNQLNKCTCEIYPPWQLIFIDEAMQEVVRTLNQKNYATISCCESHFNGNKNIYVAFATDYNFTSLPNGFSYSKKDKAIEHFIKSTDKSEFEAEKAQYISLLLKWTQELPNR